MIDLTENTIIFTLNGEVLMSDSGSETAFREIEIGDGTVETPLCPSWFLCISPNPALTLCPSLSYAFHSASCPWLPLSCPTTLTAAHPFPPIRLPARL